MKQALIIGGACVGGLVLLTFVVMLFMGGSQGAPVSHIDSGGTVPVTVTQPYNEQHIDYIATSSRGSSGKMPLQLATGQGIVVTDIVHLPTTVTDPSVPNRFFLSGGVDPVGSDFPYSIYYSPIDQSFTIILLADPLSYTRDQAELDLVGKLGIQQSEDCYLRYQVIVPSWQSSQYSGQNLGFAHCAGSIPLN
jgi:hypothetical protein